jgi:hypothetical protein
MYLLKVDQRKKARIFGFGTLLAKTGSKSGENTIQTQRKGGMKPKNRLSDK